MDWYRRKTWTSTDKEEFFTKLGRARKDGRAQYLKIQAIELVETKNKKLLEVAEMLLNKMLTFPSGLKVTMDILYRKTNNQKHYKIKL